LLHQQTQVRNCVVSPTHEDELSHLREVLDHLTIGIIILDRSGNVLRVNRAAWRLAEGAHELEGLEEGVIPFEESSLLGIAVRNAAMAGGMHRRCRTLTFLARESDKHRLHVCVLPLGAGDRRGGVALFLGDGSGCRGPRPEVLEQLWRLTPAEARVASALLHGSTLGETARHLGITISTARSHLSRILGKTGTRRQADLLRVLAGGLSVLDLDD
jgi:DNA-binding CsgD family transcriptional regulator